MRIDGPEITALRVKIRAADEEFRIAVHCHEAWKPAAYDGELHARVGHSYAANTFLLIRQVLRREMVLSLMRLWDNDKRLVGMPAIANALSDKRVVDLLAEERVAQWSTTPRIYGLEDIPEEQRAAVIEAATRGEAEFGCQQGRRLREQAAEAVRIIRAYDAEEPGRSALEKLRAIRNERLAHRRVSEGVASANLTNDEEIETFYWDMARLVPMLLEVVLGVSYSPEDTAAIHARHAALFWSGVKGERTKGHPAYREPGI